MQVLNGYYCADPGIFSGGGGGGVQARRPENSQNAFFLVLNLFYSLQRGSNGFIIKKTILFQGSRGGPTFSRGSNFFQEGSYNL